MTDDKPEVEEEWVTIPACDQHIAVMRWMASPGDDGVASWHIEDVGPDCVEVTISYTKNGSPHVEHHRWVRESAYVEGLGLDG